MVERGIHFDDAIHEFEKRFISRVLGCCDGSLIKTAETLGIHRNTLTRKMDDLQDQEARLIERHRPPVLPPPLSTPLLTLPAADI